MSREKLKAFIPKNRPVLEIGPYNCPFIAKGEYDVYYADIATTEELFNGGYGNGVENLTHIDYPVKGTYKEAVCDKKFAAVFSSHVFEHIPNPIKHLQELAEILEDDGRVVMCVPDKRFTFDYFREVTPLRDLYDVYLNGGNVLGRLVFDCSFLYDYSHKYDDFMLDEVPFDNIANDKSRQRGFPGNPSKTHAHFWVFTDVSYLVLIRDLLRLNLLPFTLEDFYPTEFGRNEFHAVLRKDSTMLSDDKERKHEVIRINKMAEGIRNNPTAVESKVCEFKAVLSHCKKNYIYGAGTIGHTIARLLIKNKLEFDGFIVTDGYTKCDIFHGYPCWYLSEVTFDDDTGVILALDSKNCAQVEPLLKERGVQNYITV